MGDNSSSITSDILNLRNTNAGSKPSLPELIGFVKNDMPSLSRRVVPLFKPKKGNELMKLLQKRRCLLFRKVRTPSKGIYCIALLLQRTELLIRYHRFVNAQHSHYCQGVV